MHPNDSVRYVAKTEINNEHILRITTLRQYHKSMTPRPVFEFQVNDRAFRAIDKGTKKVEVRANRVNTIISCIKKGDMIQFKNILTYESVHSVVSRVTLYPTVRQLLEREGTEQTLSSKGTLEEGIKSIESISD